MQKVDYPNAEIWYRSVAIDPNRETLPLFRHALHEATEIRNCRDRYVLEAYIAERQRNKIFSRWANSVGANHKKHHQHPRIEIPVNVTTTNDKGERNMNIPANMITGPTDGSNAWILYGGTRIAWRKEKFAAQYPNEKVYRHSLDEEAAALRVVVTMATSDKGEDSESVAREIEKVG